MPLPRWLARFNRRVANPIFRLAAGRVLYLGLVHHRGRRSRREYRTPVLAFPRSSGFTIALIYGRDADWAKNVRAAGGCRIVYRGRAHDTSAPTLISLDEADGVPRWIRAIMRRLKADSALLLETSGGPSRGA